MLTGKIMLVLSVMVVALFAAALPALANDYSESAHGQFHYTGKITAIDPAGKILTVQAGPKDESYFEVKDDASVRVCDKEMSFKDLKVGDTVSITYYSESLGGSRIAEAVLERDAKC